MHIKLHRHLSKVSTFTTTRWAQPQQTGNNLYNQIIHNKQDCSLPDRAQFRYTCLQAVRTIKHRNGAVRYNLWKTTDSVNCILLGCDTIKGGDSYKTTWRHILEDHKLHIHSCDYRAASSSKPLVPHLCENFKHYTISGFFPPLQKMRSL